MRSEKKNLLESYLKWQRFYAPKTIFIDEVEEIKKLDKYKVYFLKK